MPRYFVPITKEELNQKIEEAEVSIGSVNLTPQIEKDLEKVQFDWENRDPQGFHTLDNGLTFLGGSAGGDWEYPVSFIIYWDGKKLRAYIPTEGNYFNRTTKFAYGNALESNDDKYSDARDLQKHHFPHRTLEECLEAENDLPYTRGFLNDAMEADIKKRIIPKAGSVTFTVKQPKQPKQPKKPIADRIKEIVEKTKAEIKITSISSQLEQRIKSLVFFGTGDEAYELFAQTTSFCYTLWGAGCDKEAEIVCGWAEDQERANHNWLIQNPEFEYWLDEGDYQTGHFGN